MCVCVDTRYMWCVYCNPYLLGEYFVLAGGGAPCRVVVATLPRHVDVEVAH